MAWAVLSWQSLTNSLPAQATATTGMGADREHDDPTVAPGDTDGPEVTPSADDGDGSPDADSPLPHGRARLDLARTRIAVPVPTLTPVPAESGLRRPVPWIPLGVGVISLAIFLGSWLRTRRRPLLPGPASRPIYTSTSTSTRAGTRAGTRASTRAGTGRVQPELDRGTVAAFVEREQQDTLVWGIGREVSDVLSERLDAVRTVEATIAQGGLPQLLFEPHLESNGVWLWRDRRMKTGLADAKRLEREIVQTLDVAGLPVRVATFAGVPDRLDDPGGPSFAPLDLDDQRRHARVVVLTDGHGLLRRARMARTRDEVLDLLRRLQGWHALAFAVFGELRAEVEQLLAGHGIECVSPPDAVTYLAGALREGTDLERERELLRWEVACALAPRRIREADALALRAALGLRIEGFAIDTLRRRHGHGPTLVWDAAPRAEVLARYDRAYGYTALGPRALDEGTLLGRALGFWRDYYAQALEHEALDVDTAIYLEIEALVLGLWDRPVAAVRGTPAEQGLYGLFQVPALAPAVRDLVSQYTDLD
ncbi:MAG: hypothetical protein KDK70_40950, partial [Myxococcales bacterium]|nr:hypothetical protein [Myxococcales bacterium]